MWQKHNQIDTVFSSGVDFVFNKAQGGFHVEGTGPFHVADLASKIGKNPVDDFILRTDKHVQFETTNLVTICLFVCPKFV